MFEPTKVCNVQPALSSCRNFGWTCQSCPGLFLTHGQVGVAALDYLRLSGFLSIPHFLTNRLKMTPDCKHLLFRSTTNYMTHLIVSFSMCHAVSSFLFFTPALTVVRHPSRWYNFSYLACNFLSNPWCQEECNQTLEQCFLKKHLIVGQSNMDRCLWKTVSLIRIPLSILSSISCGAPTRGTN